MADIKYICPECGHEFQQGEWNYNYDTAQLDFECPFCEWQGTDNNVVTEEDKLQRANDNITELVDKLAGLVLADNSGNCLKAVLFDEDRNCEGELTCSSCNYRTFQRYKEMLLDKYLVK